MTTLPTIQKQTINTNLVKTINARDLWTYLGIRRDFSTWIKTQIKSLGLEENIDYIKLPLKGELSKTGQTLLEYTITLNTAKHISMASRTVKGREARNYFIEIENNYKNPTPSTFITGYTSHISKPTETKITEAEKRALRLDEIMNDMEILIKKYSKNPTDIIEFFIEQNQQWGKLLKAYEIHLEGNK